MANPRSNTTDLQQPPLYPRTVEESIAEAHSIIERAKQTHPYIACVAMFSGGNDSTTMLHIVKDHIDFALHINTGIGIERTREFVRQTCVDFDVKLVEKKTDPAWYRNYVVERGFPGPMGHRVMYHKLKQQRIRDLRRELRTKKGEKLLLLTGERAHESARRASYGDTTVNFVDGNIWANPIRFFTDWDMYAYRQKYTVPRNPVSDRIHKSGECLCGAFALRRELDEIEMWFPDTVAYIRDLEAAAEEAGHGKRAKWAWGSEDRNWKQDAPGPMCSSCHLFPQEEAVS